MDTMCVAMPGTSQPLSTPRLPLSSLPPYGTAVTSTFTLVFRPPVIVSVVQQTSANVFWGLGTGMQSGHGVEPLPLEVSLKHVEAESRFRGEPFRSRGGVLRNPGAGAAGSPMAVRE